jgi:hypothetical protein
LQNSESAQSPALEKRFCFAYATAAPDFAQARSMRVRLPSPSAFVDQIVDAESREKLTLGLNDVRRCVHLDLIKSDIHGDVL